MEASDDGAEAGGRSSDGGEGGTGWGGVKVMASALWTAHAGWAHAGWTAHAGGRRRRARGPARIDACCPVVVACAWHARER